MAFVLPRNIIHDIKSICGVLFIIVACNKGGQKITLAPPPFFYWIKFNGFEPIGWDSL